MSQGNLVQVLFKKFLHGCRLVFSDGLQPLRLVFSTHFYLLLLVLRGWSGFWCRLFTIMTLGVGNCNGLLSTTALLLSTGSNIVTTAPVSILSFLASKLRYRSF